MSVQSDVSRIEYTGNGSAVTPYPVPFVFHEAAHIRVVRVDDKGADTELRLGQDYSLAGAGSNAGGSVTTKAAVSATHKLVIYREVPVVQQSQFIENDPFPASTVERTVDALTMICQQLARKLARTFRLPDHSPDLPPMALPGAGSNSMLVMGEDGELHFWSLQKLKEEFAALAAVPPMLQALMVQYPVGCLYFTRRPENPHEILGFGEWRRYGAGRMVISLDPNNPALSQIDTVGGEAAVALSGEHVGPHRHTVQAHNAMETSPSGEHVHETMPRTIKTNADGRHRHTVTTRKQDANGLGAITTGRDAGNDEKNSSWDGLHDHTVNIPALSTRMGGEHSHIFDIPEHETAAAGEGLPHNNMPPYIVVNVWTRVSNDAPAGDIGGNPGGTLPFPADPAVLVDRVTGEKRRLVVDNTVIGTVPMEDS